MEQALQTKQHFDLYGLHFDSDKATIQPESKSLLDDISTALKNFPDWHLRIIGHTDATGDFGTQRSSLSRASARYRGGACGARRRLSKAGDGRSRRKPPLQVTPHPTGARSIAGSNSVRVTTPPKPRRCSRRCQTSWLRKKPCRSASTRFSKSSPPPIRNWVLRAREP